MGLHSLSSPIFESPLQCPSAGTKPLLGKLGFDALTSGASLFSCACIFLEISKEEESRKGKS